MKHLNEQQILTSNYPYYKYSLDYALDSLERMGHENIEFYGCFPHFHLDDVGYKDVRQLKGIKRSPSCTVCFTPDNVCIRLISRRKILLRGREVCKCLKSLFYMAVSWERVMLWFLPDMELG